MSSWYLDDYDPGERNPARQGTVVFSDASTMAAGWNLQKTAPAQKKRSPVTNSIRRAKESRCD
jgi:hypothetical protein